MTEAKLVKTIFINAKPERVWAFLTEPELLGRWFHASKAKLEAGADYELFKEGDDKAMCWGRVLESEAPSRLVYTFTHGMLKGHETRVEWTLSSVEAGTMLEMVHDGFEGGEHDLFNMLISHDKGWDDHFGRLRSKCAEAEA